MRLNVNPTRMELLALKDRLSLARRGHKLLKDKLEGLLKNFLDLSNQFIRRREEFDYKFSEILKRYYTLTASYTPEELELILSGGDFKINLSQKELSIMNVRFPVFLSEFQGTPYSYPFTFLNSDFDLLYHDVRESLLELIELSSIQQELFLIALEISKVRRRVNALEYIMIPNLEETVKYIADKLEELERENIARLLKVKDIISGKG